MRMRLSVELLPHVFCMAVWLQYECCCQVAAKDCCYRASSTQQAQSSTCVAQHAVQSIRSMNANPPPGRQKQPALRP